MNRRALVHAPLRATDPRPARVQRLQYPVRQPRRMRVRVLGACLAARGGCGGGDGHRAAAGPHAEQGGDGGGAAAGAVLSKGPCARWKGKRPVDVTHTSGYKRKRMDSRGSTVALVKKKHESTAQQRPGATLQISDKSVTVRGRWRGMAGRGGRGVRRSGRAFSRLPTSPATLPGRRRRPPRRPPRGSCACAGR